MAKVSTTVKEAVKESLVGTQEEPVQVSTQHKARFTSHAVKDPETGDLFLGPDQFIDAVAPPDEDFVSLAACAPPNRCACNHGVDQSR
jgi:solute carrier family 25 (mitochondrial aspartate/glutamate transporter), member 12/13